MPLIAGGNAPYAPPGTVIEVITRYRERGLTKPFTADVLERAGVPETLSNRTLHTLKLLELVDSEGNPTADFEAASRAPDNEYKQRLADLILGTYSEVFSFADPAEDSYERVRDAFRAFNPRGQHDRMVTLYLGLLDFVDIDTSKASASRKREPGAPKSNGSTRPAARVIPAGATKSKPTPPKAKGRSTGTNPVPEQADDLPPALVGLLRQIPRNGAGWPQSRRDDFLNAFKAVLDFTVPVRDHEPPTTTTEDD
jgi:hypothetical protein